MAKYDVALRDVILNGINISHYGDTVAEHSRDNPYTEIQKGAKGDAVTYAKYDTIDKIRCTQLYNSPVWGQLESWAKNHTYLSLQFTDGNTGEKRSSTTATIESLGTITDGQQREFNIHCEELV